jgi:hypothetical protein
MCTTSRKTIKARQKYMWPMYGFGLLYFLTSMEWDCRSQLESGTLKRKYHCLIYANSSRAYREYNFYTYCRIAPALPCVCMQTCACACLRAVWCSCISKRQKEIWNSMKCVTFEKGNICLESKLCDYGTQTPIAFFSRQPKVKNLFCADAVRVLG